MSIFLIFLFLLFTCYFNTFSWNWFYPYGIIHLLPFLTIIAITFLCSFLFRVSTIFFLHVSSFFFFFFFFFEGVLFLCCLFLFSAFSLFFFLSVCSFSFFSFLLLFSLFALFLLTFSLLVPLSFSFFSSSFCFLLLFYCSLYHLLF